MRSHSSRAVGTVVLSMALIVLALSILVGAHVIYYSLATYRIAGAPGRLSASMNVSQATSWRGAHLVPVNVTNHGPEEVRITRVVVEGGAPEYYPYGATLFPGQSVVIYVPLDGGVGFETNYGTVWARVVR
ncbi:hypothetical protein [Conexivisphaera calida]|uniref:Uncharacterized protein n=1 Tax=Conexivisphaera calida TaxID=1874277 RepID=A0A4P2VD36_9ARCH|nr:hypothetical protein [Conexivisphaera calida]BBE42061.1 hypothetical protein NAS2_0672 [Conexivisphaera calida]